jgi:hypothetical protein
VANPTDFFEQQMPQIEDGDLLEAATKHRIIQSFNAYPIFTAGGEISGLAIKWKLSNGNTETVLIGHYAALTLRIMFSRLEENKWTELVLVLPDVTPH